MDFISSISFPNTMLNISCHHFWVGLVLLCCCIHPKVMTKMANKCSTLCSTDQRFIRKRNTTYKIHTLAGSSRTALRILIFSIAVGADYSFEVKKIEIWAPSSFKHDDLFLATVGAKACANSISW